MRSDFPNFAKDMEDRHLHLEILLNEGMTCNYVDISTLEKC